MCRTFKRYRCKKIYKPILRYVASHFHFDKLKFMNEDPVLSDESDEVLVKKIKKVIVKKK